ncbi:transposase [Parabacteroides distasonis]|uniref:transposase n=1 Tax=Parabacteroides distasonis TaxID=823 RepID=UPI00189F7BB1|nr:transposase [Parabacteroides distasonis]MDB9154241.1 transposase [Parabacteroides distasonis]MDB9158749.1 transposase [Parabacteroides distasonis]MDB9167527.1 transposase [Parabacteroides distasonis]MDB9172056.1 transposase [Parabacteroides distasonis]MDB9197070.1 transposase [Parabacteroides distasonis]
MAKGRSKNLISLRDEKLIRRYYYWTEIRRRRFDDALEILSQEEFFISEARIMAIIRKNCDKLTDIEVRPVPKVKMPRVTARQLTLFAGE